VRNERRRATLADAARTEPTDIDFLDQLLQQETAAKRCKRIAMGIQIAHGPMVKTLADFDF
jgi:IstB-like ATP binding protein